MLRLRFAPIVEGHGEIDAVSVLLRRLGSCLFPGVAVEVLKPFRVPRSKLVQGKELERAIRLARMKLDQIEGDSQGLVLVLFDADDDKPCQLAPQLLAQIRSFGLAEETCVVLAEKEFESWFAAAAKSLERYLDLVKAPLLAPPEAVGKGWVERAFRGPKYSETIDQPKLTAAMDLELCRSSSKSFDKLCRELESFSRRVCGGPSSAPGRGG